MLVNKFLLISTGSFVFRKRGRCCAFPIKINCRAAMQRFSWPPLPNCISRGGRTAAIYISKKDWPTNFCFCTSWKSFSVLSKSCVFNSSSELMCKQMEGVRLRFVLLYFPSLFVLSRPIEEDRLICIHQRKCSLDNFLHVTSSRKYTSTDRCQLHE